MYASTLISIRRSFDFPMLALMFFALASPASAQWTEQVVHDFQFGSDGGWPVGSLVSDSAGNLYGATQIGGADTCPSNLWCGVVFELSPPQQQGGAWTETILHIFLGYPYGDASAPLGGLVIDASGNLYGSTGYGGTGDCEILNTYPGCGAVYEVSPPQQQGGEWTERVLYSFQGGSDGYVPYGDLVADSEGNLYGTTLWGGGRGANCGDDPMPYCGTVFELSPPSQQDGVWREQILYSFEGKAPEATRGDGARPNGGLVFDKEGNLYGTTQLGGYTRDLGSGTVFRLNRPANQDEPWTETVIHAFLGYEDGDDPNGNLVLDKNGNLYGSTEEGGNSRYPSGEVFELVPQSDSRWTNHVLYSFYDGSDGGYPAAGVTMDASGNIYGTTTAGGASRAGTIYELKPTALFSRQFELVYPFAGTPDGSYSESTMIFDTANALYGSTLSSGTGTGCSTGCGIIFELKR